MKLVQRVSNASRRSRGLLAVVCVRGGFAGVLSPFALVVADPGCRTPGVAYG